MILIKLWLLGLFITTLMNVIRRKYKYEVLCCGMVGYSGDKPADPNLLKMLMVYNQERGEDGTGWAVNNKIEKDTKTVKKFLSEHKLLISEEDENYSFIGHARKASSGNKTKKELVHPFGMYKGDNEKDQYDVILAMNGTMVQVDEYAKHFKVPYIWNDNSDTQIVAKVIAELGEKDYIKAIAGINGAATLLFLSPKFPNTLMVYKDPERQLYYWQKSKNEIYISSLEESLYTIGAEIKDTNSFEDGHLYKINKGKITSHKFIKRDPIKYVYVKHDTTFHRGSESYEGSYGHMGVGRDTFRSNKNRNTANISRSSLDVFAYNVDDNKKKEAGCIHFHYDKYQRNGHPITGAVLLDKNGKEYKDGEKKDFCLAYFVAGFLIKSEKAHQDIKEKFYDSNGQLDLKKFKAIPLSQMVEYFAYPVTNYTDAQQKWILNNQWSKKVVKAGDTFKFEIPYTKLEYELKYDGMIIKNEGFPNVKVCTLNSVRQTDSTILLPVSDFSKLEIGEPFVKMIESSIAASEFIASSDIYMAVRTKLWQSNASADLRVFFYTKFIELMRKKAILGEEDMNRIIRIATECKFSPETAIFAQEMKFCIKVFRDTIKKRLPQIVEDAEIVVDAETDISGEGSYVANFNIIESMKDSNDFFNRDDFQKDVYDADYEDLDKFASQWLADFQEYSNESRTFYEAILLCLSVVGKITDQEMVDITDSKVTSKEVKEKAETHYRNWRRETKEAEVNDEVNIEEWTPEVYEKDAEDALSNFKDIFEQTISEIEAVPENMRTERTQKILTWLMNDYKAMDEELFKNVQVNVE